MLYSHHQINKVVLYEIKIPFQISTTGFFIKRILNKQSTIYSRFYKANTFSFSHSLIRTITVTYTGNSFLQVKPKSQRLFIDQWPFYFLQWWIQQEWRTPYGKVAGVRESAESAEVISSDISSSSHHSHNGTRPISILHT